MQQAIEKAYFDAKQRWPSPKRGTLQHYATHVTALGTSRAELERYGADVYLALACGMADPDALLILETRFLPAIEEQLARSGFDEATRKDVLQQMLLHLCAGEKPRILTYAGRAALSSWLRVTATRFALNMFQRRRTTCDDHHRRSGSGARRRFGRDVLGHADRFAGPDADRWASSCPAAGCCAA